MDMLHNENITGNKTLLFRQQVHAQCTSKSQERVDNLLTLLIFE